MTIREIADTIHKCLEELTTIEKIDNEDELHHLERLYELSIDLQEMADPDRYIFSEQE